MTPRTGIPAVLLFLAAAGWALHPPPSPDRNLTGLALSQLRDDGSAAPALAARHRAAGWANFVPPVASLALCAAAVAAGVYAAHRPRRAGDGQP